MTSQECAVRRQKVVRIALAEPEMSFREIACRVCMHEATVAKVIREAGLRLESWRKRSRL